MTVYNKRRKSFIRMLALLSLITIVSSVSHVFADTAPPQNFAPSNSHQYFFYTIGSSGSNTYSQYSVWFYFGNALESGCLGDNGYCGNLNNEAVLMQGEISSSGTMCEDTGGLGDGNGPSMQVTGELSDKQMTDIINNSPNGDWNDDPQGTITVSATIDGVGISGSYDVFQVTGHLAQNSPYQSFTFNQALNGGGCKNAAYYWDFGQGMRSPANSCCLPASPGFTHHGQTLGNFWNNCWFCYPSRVHNSAGAYIQVQGT